jgi:diadenosine tetraphosphatase ApaH/serine/threonine PP2A family protein phosphatase
VAIQYRILVDTPENLIGDATIEFTKHNLSTVQLEYLATLPKTREVNGVMLLHGTPLDDELCLLERISTTGVFLDEDATIAAKLGVVPNKVIFCGHSHVARTVLLSDGRLVINPGSVGQPAYQHNKPVPHVMQSGSPHARCAVITQSKNNWNVQHLMVAYDWEAAARQAESNGRPDRANCLRTGRASLQDA